MHGTRLRCGETADVQIQLPSYDAWRELTGQRPVGGCRRLPGHGALRPAHVLPTPKLHVPRSDRPRVLRDGRRAGPGPRHVRRDRVPNQLDTFTATCAWPACCSSRCKNLPISCRLKRCAWRKCSTFSSGCVARSMFCTRSTKPRRRQWKSRGCKISAVQRRMLCACGPASYCKTRSRARRTFKAAYDAAVQQKPTHQQHHMHP